MRQRDRSGCNRNEDSPHSWLFFLDVASSAKPEGLCGTRQPFAVLMVGCHIRLSGGLSNKEVAPLWLVS